MKVIEKGTDRKAEVHMFVEGSVAELDEYAERVNPVDKAIECFVAVEEGQHPKIGGRLWATAMCYGYDAFIDGICRKANVTVGKAVTAHKSKKLDVDKFLYRTSDDRIIEAKVHVAPLPDEVVPKEGAVENLGTIELRVYVERRFGDEHALQDVITYYQVPGEGYTAGQTVGFKDIAPEYSMGYDENTATLESSSINKSRNKMGKKRPGAEPWAIFRFHLRSMNSIDEKGLPMTFDNSSKKNNRGWRELELEPLPALTIGASPKNLASSRATPAASSAPCTPAKSSTDALWLTNAVTPTKRPTTPMSTSSTPEIKRPRLSPQPTSRTLYPAPSVKGRPTVSQVVEARKRLQETKAKREATFKKQVEVTSKLSPYELQIQAQLEKLARDDEEQRRMHEQEEQRLHEDMALLQELQSQKMEE
ncbi:hypothetical protein K504DRAFT_380565 [Pleomassaria siparia CBS 279.74]|uniref:Uncharacterized protein n=1 Tax=Pleomassaria siparia CBS 279.74 TaxID=1314801 RepID=A0A6G1K7X8_9PLEO|nr:hypothetical protein K504DRAFT_380565 [Pleomassaria siparia CBS 279.74]